MHTLSPARCSPGEHSIGFMANAVGHRLESCESPVWMGCWLCSFRRLARCKSSDEKRCVHCAGRYRRRVCRVADSGRVRYPGRQLLMLTLTAPGDGEHVDKRTGRVCGCTKEGGTDLAHWNQRLGHNWNRFLQDLRRMWRHHLQYFRGVEVQKRGALHLHVLVRLGPRGLVLNHHEREKLRELAMHHGFGHEVRCEAVRDGGASGYVAKYVSKAVADRGEVPWRRVDNATGEVRLKASYRTWSCSRRWGQTMAAVIAEQVEWAVAGSCGGGSSAAAGCDGLAPKAPLDTDSQRYTSVVIDGPSLCLSSAM